MRCKSGLRVSSTKVSNPKTLRKGEREGGGGEREREEEGRGRGGMGMGGR